MVRGDDDVPLLHGARGVQRDCRGHDCREEQGGVAGVCLTPSGCGARRAGRGGDHRRVLRRGGAGVPFRQARLPPRLLPPSDAHRRRHDLTGEAVRGRPDGGAARHGGQAAGAVGDVPAADDLQARHVCLPPQRHPRHRKHVVLLLHKRAPLQLHPAGHHQRRGGRLLLGGGGALRQVPLQHAVPPNPHMVHDRQHPLRALAADPRLWPQQDHGHPRRLLLPGRERNPLCAGLDQHHAHPRARRAALPRGHGGNHVRPHHEHRQPRGGGRGAARGRDHVGPRHHGGQPRQLLDPRAHLQHLDRAPPAAHRVDPRGR
mmetsp:Transcript_17939/g.41470  ORF Transcript_17939/g.41470 Transcript_17939/m.41470 type:complete len:316 (-) Transcript_17939:175-1122(-)